LFAHQRDDSISLEGLCRFLFQRGPEMAKQSLQDRFTDSAVGFMKEMVSYALKQKLEINFDKLHKKFNRILISDSTQFELPSQFQNFYKGNGGGASPSSIKVQYCFDLLSSCIVSLLNKNGVENDFSADTSYFRKNDLVIEDLGFFNIKRFKNMMQCGAYFLSRFRFGRLIFRNSGQDYEIFDLLSEEKKMKHGEICQCEAYIDKKEKLPVRLIVEKVPEEIANERRRKLKTDRHNKRKNISKERLKLCNLNVYITNTTDEDLPMKSVRRYYSLRWQIEILFKAWKSVYKIDQVKPMKIQRFECMHYGLLMLIILTTHIVVCFKKAIRKFYKKELSEFKLFKCIKEVFPALSDSVKKKKQFSKFIDNLFKSVLNTCIKDNKSNKMTPFLILNIAS
jgi:Transposase DDE domain